MQEEFLVVVCPNPKCQREIEEPVLLNNLSVTPAEQYNACPHCLTKLKDVFTISQEEVTEKPVPVSFGNSVLEKVKDSGPRLLEKVKNLIPAVNVHQEEKEATEIKEEPKTQPSIKEEKKHSGCSYKLGYLANRPKNAPIPPECLVCQKIVECMLKVKE